MSVAVLRVRAMELLARPAAAASSCCARTSLQLPAPGTSRPRRPGFPTLRAAAAAAIAAEPVRAPSRWIYRLILL
jgi:hypothetical protein